MLTTASQFTPRARSLHTRHAATARALGAGCAQGIRQRQQTRGFRWGLWSNLDDDVSRELRRRQRMLKHKYSEQLNRRLSWEKHPFSEDSRHALKRMMKSYWHSSYPNDRFGDEADRTKYESSESKTAPRPGRNIEDVERGAIDHLMFGEDEEPLSHQQSQNRHSKRRRVRKLKYMSEVLYGQPVEIDGYVIDPITNRKVAKLPPSSTFENGEDVPVKTFKDYRSQFTSPDVTSEHSSSSRQQDSPGSQSDGYVQSTGSRGDEHSHTEALNFMEDHPVISRKPDNAACDESSNHKPVKDAEMDANLASTVDGLSENDHDIMQRGKTMEEVHHKFGDLQPPKEGTDDNGYKSALADEISSRLEGVEPRNVSGTKSAMGETDTVRNAESIEDLVDQDISCQREGKPLGFREEFVKPEVLRRYRSTIHLVEPGDFSDSTVEDLRAKYGDAELKQYTTVRYVEPVKSSRHTVRKTKDDVRSATSKEPKAKQTSTMEEMSGLGARQGLNDVIYHEPEGPAVAQIEQDQEVLNAEIEHDTFPQVDPADKHTRHTTGHEALERLVSVKQGHGRRSSDSEYMAPNEPEPEMASDPMTKASLRPDLEQLTSVKQGQGKQSNYREMLESLMSQHEQLSDAHDHEATLAVRLAKVKSQEVDRQERKLTGNYVRDFPEEFEKSWTQTLSSLPAEAQTSYEPEAPTESEAMDGGLEGAFGRPTPARVEPALERCGSMKADVGQYNHGAKEFESPEASSNDKDGDRIQPFGDSCDGKDENKVNTDMHEETSNAGQDEVRSYTKELRDAPEKMRSTSQSEPVLYKILAYDPTMQKINIAETTSFVPDFTSALSPADALLRLSHPTKFFPHFASLEAEGFEIASGSGDVLVFRKVRPSKPEQVEETPTETTSPAAEQSSSIESPVNPIDMTGRPRVVSPASANFASPTGYVKYENLPETEADKLPPPPPPRVAYNINLRREEPVFSGPKHRTYGEQKQKKSLGHRLLIGGAWVAGVSYGLGVVSEYFITGGMDGMGPQSL